MQNTFKGVFKDKRVLVTGHTGFKGSWLSLWLNSLGARVCGYSLPPNTEPSMFSLVGLNESMESHFGDIRDAVSLKKVFDDFKPEIVFHLAAQPLVVFSYSNPVYTYETNVMGTVNVLEAARKCKETRVVLNITTDKCYDNKEWAYGYREVDPLGGADPYSSSKAASELVSAAYRSSYFNPKDFNKTHQTALSTARAGNVIGGGDWAENRIVPDCINALAKGESINIRNPQSIRPWQHVLEPVCGYLHLASLMYLNGFQYSSAWNFGPNDSDVWTVEDIVSKIIKYWGCGDYKVVSDSKFHEANLLKLDISKSKSELKWAPHYSCEEAVAQTVEWYQNYLKCADMRSFTIGQIERFAKSAHDKGANWCADYQSEYFGVS